MDACPGRLNQVSLFIYRLGIFYGQCSEICGINHGFMPIVVESLSVKKYSSWVFNSLVSVVEREKKANELVLSQRSLLPRKMILKFQEDEVKWEFSFSGKFNSDDSFLSNFIGKKKRELDLKNPPKKSLKG